MYNQQDTELEILKFWERNKIFDKLRKKNKGKKKWSFLDGPITANNSMGVHHAWGRTYKDLFQRFKAMQGYETRYQNGFDCQGLWVEREEEKNLGLKNKEDIEKFGILNFVRACRKRVEKFSKIQTEQSIRLGYWMDWKNSYYTMSDTNQLHNWLLIKTYFNKKWLYKGKGSVPWCWRCGTASSKHDIATEGYREVSHKALFMQFPVKGKTNEYFLIFTTTPWTVPANVSIAVNKNINYVKVENKEKKYWLAESRLDELNGEYKILEKKKGGELNGLEYTMPYSNFESQKDSPNKVVLWELASEEEGTGIVHIAPGCGAEDFDLGKKLNLPEISPLDEAGIYKEGFGDFSLKKYSEVNELVLTDLDKRNFVYKIENIKHRYPHCWRCGEELIFRLVNEWYVKCDEIRDKLIKENKKIKWYPEYGKGRQEEWFKNMGDWLISRKRYWGLPLPIWECECGWYDVVGSLEELNKKAIDKKKVDKLPEIHRPWIDEIKIKCQKCGKEVSRITDVGDAWLDAGIVPFSTLGYLTNKKEWERWFPVELISENMPGQFRGWFNALFWASVTLTGKAPFKSLFGYETLKDEKGEEMHKSKGNAIWFDEIVERVGADAMRLLYCLQDPSLELRFGLNVLKEPGNNLNILYNLSKLIENSSKTKFSKIEDRWILSKLNNLIKKFTEELEEMHPHIATKELKDFWINNLSRRYIQFIRDRLANDDKEAFYVLNEVYLILLKLCAPIIPFITESIWQDLRKMGIIKEESIHLTDWPKFDKKLINKKLEEKFELVFEIIEKGLSERDKLKIGLKWPLAKIIVKTSNKINKDLLQIIKNQLNIKKVEIINIKGKKEISIELDIKITPELEAEGYAREISRKIQDSRKKAEFVKGDEIKLAIMVSSEIFKLLESQKNFIKERVNAKEILITNNKKLKKYDYEIDDKIKNNNLCKSGEVCDFKLGCVKTSCLQCNDCDNFFGNCDYNKCKVDCSVNTACYYKGRVLGDNCVSLDEACKSINSCSNYSLDECSNDPCSISKGKKCEVINNKCVETNYCGDGIKSDLEECDDGNLVNGDCCSTECKIEPDFDSDGVCGESDVEDTDKDGLTNNLDADDDGDLILTKRELRIDIDGDLLVAYLDDDEKIVIKEEIISEEPKNIWKWLISLILLLLIIYLIYEIRKKRRKMLIKKLKKTHEN